MEIDSTLCKQTYTKKSPRRNRLPPEILQQIFISLEPEELFGLPLDQLACSLVCKDWGLVAKSLLNDKLFDVLWCLDHYQVAQLARLVRLLKEAERVGVDYSCLKFEEFKLDEGVLQLRRSRDLTFDEFSAKILIRLFSLRCMKFKNIDINTSSFLSEEKTNFYKLIQPFCTNVQTLYIHDYHGGLLTHGSKFVRSLNENIRHLRRLPITIDSSTATIFVSYRQATQVSFKKILLKRLGDWLRCFRVFDLLRRRQCRYLDRAMRTLMYSCGDLETLEFRSKITVSWTYISSKTLSSVIQQSNHLERFAITYCAGVDDAFLVVLARCAANLRSLEMIACNYATGKNVAHLEEKDYRMTELRELNLVECDGLYPQFVGRVVASCEKLARVQLPQHLNNNGRLREILRLFEFRRSESDVWTRLVEA